MRRADRSATLAQKILDMAVEQGYTGEEVCEAADAVRITLLSAKISGLFQRAERKEGHERYGVCERG